VALRKFVERDRPHRARAPAAVAGGSPPAGPSLEMGHA
jgi:hypothetical protein